MINQQWKQKILFAQTPTFAKETSEGFLLIESAQAPKKSSLIGSIVGFLLATIFILLFWWFFLIIAVIGGIIALFIPSARNHLFAYFRLFPGELLFRHYPLKLGEECVFTFRRRLKKDRKTRQPGELILKIYCVERVNYQRGTDTETEINIIWESPSFNHPLDTGIDTLYCQTNFKIPDNLPPSYEGKNNQIRWVASIEQSVSGIVDHVYSNFTLIIDPVIVS